MFWKCIISFSFCFVFVSFWKMLEGFANEVGTKNGIVWKLYGNCVEMLISPQRSIQDESMMFATFWFVSVWFRFFSFSYL